MKDKFSLIPPQQIGRESRLRLSPDDLRIINESFDRTPGVQQQQNNIQQQIPQNQPNQQQQQPQQQQAIPGTPNQYNQNQQSFQSPPHQNVLTPQLNSPIEPTVQQNKNLQMIYQEPPNQFNNVKQLKNTNNDQFTQFNYNFNYYNAKNYDQQNQAYNYNQSQQYNPLQNYNQSLFQPVNQNALMNANVNQVNAQLNNQLIIAPPADLQPFYDKFDQFMRRVDNRLDQNQYVSDSIVTQMNTQYALMVNELQTILYKHWFNQRPPLNDYQLVVNFLQFTKSFNQNDQVEILNQMEPIQLYSLIYQFLVKFQFEIEGLKQMQTQNQSQQGSNIQGIAQQQEIIANAFNEYLDQYLLDDNNTAAYHNQIVYENDQCYLLHEFYVKQNIITYLVKVGYK